MPSGWQTARQVHRTLCIEHPGRWALSLGQNGGGTGPFARGAVRGGRHRRDRRRGRSKATPLTNRLQQGRWSERQDSNLRPLDPQSSALPGCATLREALRIDGVRGAANRKSSPRRPIGRDGSLHDSIDTANPAPAGSRSEIRVFPEHSLPGRCCSRRFWTGRLQGGPVRLPVLPIPDAGGSTAGLSSPKAEQSPGRNLQARTSQCRRGRHSGPDAWSPGPCAGAGRP